MTLYGLASIFVGIVYFFGIVCPKFEEVNKMFEKKSKVEISDSEGKDKSLIKKFYGGARKFGDFGKIFLECGEKICINSYIMFGTSMDKEGNIKLWNWFDEAKKIHKGQNFEGIIIKKSNTNKNEKNEPKDKVIPPKELNDSQ